MLPIKKNNFFNAQFSFLIKLVTSFALCVLPATVLADEFWAQGFVQAVDISYGDDPLQTMDAFEHGARIGEPTYFAPDESPRPTLMWIHGGGWVAGDKASQTSQLIPYLQRGWRVFNVNYRQGPDTAPNAVDDVMCAYKYIEQRLRKAGQPTDQIVVSGASAGGHLALVVGLLNASGAHRCQADTPPRAVVNWFGITDIEMVDEYLQGRNPKRNYARSWAGSAAKIAAVSEAFSPLYLISDKAPPIISVHGTNDTVVPYDQGEALHASLITPNELVTLPGGNHSGFTNAQYIEAYSRIFKFLAAH